MSPLGLPMTCRLMPCLVLAGVEGPVSGDAVDRDEGPGEDEAGVSGLLRVADRLTGCQSPRVIRMPAGWWDAPPAVGCPLNDGPALPAWRAALPGTHCSPGA